MSTKSYDKPLAAVDESTLFDYSELYLSPEAMQEVLNWSEEQFEEMCH